MTNNREKQRIIDLSDQIYEASKNIRILRSISWPIEVRNEFFRKKAQKLPEITYPIFDPQPTLEILEDAKKKVGTDELVDAWFTRTIRTLESSALLLASCGTKDFHRHSADLYGVPKDVLPDNHSTSLELAYHFEEVFEKVGDMDLGAPPEACILAKAVVNDIKEAVDKMFGDLAPEVVLDNEMASNAIAGRRRIRVRETACFSDNDIDQLIHHEAFIHVATSINGNEQKDLKILVAAHPGTTKTQEGLAVFAEFITGSIDLDRLHRLSDRIIAIQNTMDGADFIDIYRYFLERTDHEEQAFENARRVFRGGVITGGAPFTKDMVYLDGLLRVHNFLRVMVSAGRSDYLKYLFCGKLDLADVPVLNHLSKMGLLKEPKFLPPWVKDLRFLLTYLAYSSFLNSIDLSKIKQFYRDMLH